MARCPPGQACCLPEDVFPSHVGLATLAATLFSQPKQARTSGLPELSSSRQLHGCFLTSFRYAQMSLHQKTFANSPACHPSPHPVTSPSEVWGRVALWWVCKFWSLTAATAAQLLCLLALWLWACHYLVPQFPPRGHKSAQSLFGALRELMLRKHPCGPGKHP